MDLDPNEIRGSGTKESVDVLQNRYFLKAERPEIGIIGGVILNEAYVNTNISGLRLGMFINEWLGFEGQWMRTTVKASNDKKTLEKMQYRSLNSSEITTVSPEINAIHSINEANVIAAPLYGKINILNQWIIYTDIYVAGGLAAINTDQGDKTALSVGIGERFYLGKSWSIRFDFKDRIFNETRGGSTARRNAESVDLGVGFFVK
jgi:outer membrane beta-barrel protein